MLSQTALKISTAAALFAAATVTASAMPAIGLVGDRTLVTFDTDNPAASATVEVTGVERLHGIDFRPADKMLYGVAADGRIVTIDPATGQATDKSKLSEMLPDGVDAIVDFNPAADRLRLMGTDGTNLRVNVDDGKVTKDGALNFDVADTNNAGKTPGVVAAAYTNSAGKPEKTAMFDIDGGMGALVQQTAPNDGVLKGIGMLGVEGAQGHAFDIHSTADLTNTAVLVSGMGLYTVNLETGAATKAGDITGVDGMIRDIAIMP